MVPGLVSARCFALARPCCALATIPSRQLPRGTAAVRWSHTQESKAKDAGEKKVQEPQGSEQPPPAAVPGADSKASPAVAKEVSQKLDRRVWAPAASTLLIGTGVGIIIPLLPMFAKDIGITPTQFGLVVTAFGASRLLANFPASWAAERFGRRPLILFGPMLSGVSMLAVSASSNFHELFAARFFAGAGGSIFMSAAQLYLADISTPANRARTIAPVYAAFGIGTACGPAIGGILGSTYGLHAPFLLVGASMLSAGALNYFTISETLPRARQAASGPASSASGQAPSPAATAHTGDVNASTSVNPSHVGTANTAHGEESRTAAPQGGAVRQTVTQWMSIAASPGVRAVLLLNTVFWMVNTGTQMSIVPFLLSDKYHFSLSNLGAIFAMTSLINVAASQPAAWVADRFGRKAAIIPGVATVCACLATLPTVTEPASAVALLAAWSLGGALLGTSPLAYVVDTTSAENRAQAVALLRSSGDLGLLLGGALMGALVEHASLFGATAFGASILGAAVLNFARSAVAAPAPQR